MRGRPGPVPAASSDPAMPPPADPWATTTVVVPFRLASARFPDKALARFEGRTLLEHALTHAASLTTGPIVLTGPPDDLAAVAGALDLGAYRVVSMPSAASCTCATERLVEIHAALPGDRFLTLPVDEPALDPAALRRAVSAGAPLDDEVAVTFHCPFHAAADAVSPLSAKVITDRHGMLLYMSRAVIPVRKDGRMDVGALKKNVGAFLFPRRFLERLGEAAGSATTLDAHEGLEQLRWLELGLRVRCLPIAHIGFGIDGPEQLEQLAARIRSA